MNLTQPIEAGNADDGVHVHVHRVDAQPLAVSELTCERIASLPPEEWLPFLRKTKTNYRRHGKLHLALTADVELALRAAKRPGPAPKVRGVAADGDDHRALLESSGFRRTR